MREEIGSQLEGGGREEIGSYLKGGEGEGLMGCFGEGY